MLVLKLDVVLVLELGVVLAVCFLLLKPVFFGGISPFGMVFVLLWLGTAQILLVLLFLAVWKQVPLGVPSFCESPPSSHLHLVFGLELTFLFLLS